MSGTPPPRIGGVLGYRAGSWPGSGRFMQKMPLNVYYRQNHLLGAEGSIQTKPDRELPCQPSPLFAQPKHPFVACDNPNHPRRCSQTVTALGTPKGVRGGGSGRSGYDRLMVISEISQAPKKVVPQAAPLMLEQRGVHPQGGGLFPLGGIATAEIYLPINRPVTSEGGGGGEFTRCAQH